MQGRERKMNTCIGIAPDERKMGSVIVEGHICMWFLACLFIHGHLLCYQFLLQFLELALQVGTGGFTPQNLGDRILLLCLQGLQMLFTTKKLLPAATQLDIQLLLQSTGQNRVTLWYYSTKPFHFEHNKKCLVICNTDSKKSLLIWSSSKRNLFLEEY